MSLRQKSIQGVFWSAVQNWGAGVLSGAVLLVLAHLLPAESFGLVALAAAFISFLEILLRQGFGLALVQREDLEPLHLTTAFWTGIGVAVVLTTVGVTCAGLVAALFNEPELAPIVRWFSLGILIVAFGNTQQAMLRRDLAFKSLAVRSLAASLGGGAVGIGMALSGYGVWSLVGQHLAAGLIGTVVLWRSTSWRPGLSFSFRHLRDLWAIGIFVTGVNLLNFLGLRIDTLLVGYFLGSEMLGYYFLAYRTLSVLLNVLAQTVSSVALSTFSRLQHDLQQMRTAMYTATQMTGLVAIPIFLGLSLTADVFVSALFGESWNASVDVLRVLALFGIVQAMTHFNGPVILACGKASWRFALAAFEALTQVVAISISVRWGLTAVATACLIRICITSPVAVWVVYKLIRIDPVIYLRRYLAPLGASGVMGGAVLGVKHLIGTRLGDAETLVVCVLVGAGVYSLVIWIGARTLAVQAWEFFRIAVAPTRGKSP